MFSFHRINKHQYEVTEIVSSTYVRTISMYEVL